MSRELRISPIGPGDLAPTVAMHNRCSAQTLWSRYHRAMGAPQTYLPTLLASAGSVHLAARDTDGRIVAVGHLMPDRSAVEAALLVEDRWQGRGVGTCLLRRLGHHVLAGGWETVHGLLIPGETRMTAILRRMPVTLQCVDDGGAITTWAHASDVAAGIPARERLRLRRRRGTLC
ncbi:GNAT family N-acetyltransferase [Streptomyces sp. NPDC060030]|uniref:GNAT family N-acetyltransferase n=1 Tax=Streptomyces sp. NPDC060030 TaxID=3347042 RepID=UPI0036CAA0DA